ncbi:MAG: precorrin-6A reductase [Phycisphaerae bacterium]|nr:precorrin-6A reductase [Phycisphaerae bacterium]
MILLLGGTSETGAAAAGLATAGFRVLVSTATDEPLAIAPHANIRRRVGRLDETAMADLVRRESVRAIVDVTHPYAAAVRATARAVATACGVTYFTFVRPGMDTHCEEASGRIVWAGSHARAARVACAFGQPVLLTTGSNNLAPYVDQSRRTGVRLIARVLPRAESIAACLAAGLARKHIIAEKGPFSLDANREHIRRFNIGVLVTKDSGAAGGVAEKIEAARLEGCKVIVVARPAGTAGANAFADLAHLVAAVVATMRRASSD